MGCWNSSLEYCSVSRLHRSSVSMLRCQPASGRLSNAQLLQHVKKNTTVLLGTGTVMPAAQVPLACAVGAHRHTS